MGLDRTSRSRPDISKYDGFKGAWDKDLNAFVFVSKEERDRFQVETYGRVRNGFREDWEAEDDRPPIRYTDPFWADETERMTYEAAVQNNPKPDDEVPSAYLQRVAAIVTGKYKAAGRPMPKAHMTRRERDRQLAKLRAQAKPDLPSGVEDYA